jgi:hypothetical protein
MSIDTVIKAKVSIGPATRCTTAAEFKAIASGSWDAISNVEDVGEMKGDKPIAVGKYVDQDYVRKLSGGPRDKGDITMIFGHDPDDDGQVALKAADEDDDAYAIKIELPDAPAGGTPTTWFFMAIVGPVSLSFGTGSDPIKLTSVFNIDGGVVEVLAAPAP